MYGLLQVYHITNKIMTAFIAIVMCFVIVRSAASSAATAPQKNQEYKLGQTLVSFRQEYATIRIGSTVVSQSWKVYEYLSGQLNPIQLIWKKTIDVKHNGNPYFVQTATSSSINVGAITSGTAGGVEQSIVMTNLLPENATFVVLYQLQVSSNGSLKVIGNNFDGKLSYRSYTNEVAQKYLLPITTNSVISNGVAVGWANAESKFISGEATLAPSVNQISATFGVITIPRNGTFTIDPSISSYPVEAGAFPVYDSSYNVLGEYTLSAMAPDNYVSPNVDFSVSGATAYQPVNSNYGVHEIKQTLTWNGDNLGNNPSNQPNGVYLYWGDLYYQENSNSTALFNLLQVVMIVLKAVATLYGVPFLAPFGFVQFSNPDNQGWNSVTNDQNAGVNTGKYTQYDNVLGSTWFLYGFIPEFKWSYLFGLWTNSDYFNYDPSSNAIEEFTYTSTVWVVNPNVNYPPVYGSVNSISFYTGAEGPA